LFRLVAQDWRVMSKKKSRKKLVAIAGLFVIGVAAVVGYQMFMVEGGESAAPEVSRELGYVNMEPFLAPIIEGRRISKYVAIGVILELHSEDYKVQVRDNIIPLRNAFIEDFVFQAQMNSGRTESVYLHRVKSRFRTLADRIVGPDIVKEVLISHALDRGF
jgi:flagellar basal body-associated protein FliL